MRFIWYLQLTGCTGYHLKIVVFELGLFHSHNIILSVLFKWRIASSGVGPSLYHTAYLTSEITIVSTRVVKSWPFIFSISRWPIFIPTVVLQMYRFSFWAIYDHEYTDIRGPHDFTHWLSSFMRAGFRVLRDIGIVGRWLVLFMNRLYPYIRSPHYLVMLDICMRKYQLQFWCSQTFIIRNLGALPKVIGRI